MKNKKEWFVPYEKIEKYKIHPIETINVRLQFNENLWGPSPKCMEALKTIVPDDLNYYDLREKDFLISSLSKLLDIPEDTIFLNAGSSEVIKTVFSVMIHEKDNVLIPYPGWGCYQGMIEAKLANAIKYNVIAGEDEYFHDIEDINYKAALYHPKIVIITTPQMPTGNRISEEDLRKVIMANPNSIIMIDECYYGCAEMNLNIKELLKEFDNIVFVRTLSKIYGLANLRVGYGIANPDLINLFDYALPLHKLPNIIRKIARAAVEDTEYTEKNKKEIIEARTWLIEQLNQRKGIKAYNSYANFVYVKLQGYDAVAVHTYMAQKGMTTRLFEEQGIAYMRITVAPMDILHKFMKVFDEALMHMKNSNVI